MKTALVICINLLGYSFIASAGPKCMSGAEMPFQQVFSEKTGLQKALQATNMAGLNAEAIVNTCEAICTGNAVLFYDNVALLIVDQNLTRTEKIKKFFKEDFYGTKCAEGNVPVATNSCDNSGQNFLRTALEDFADLIVDDIIINQSIDLNRQDSDGLSTIGWLNQKCNDKNADKEVSAYFCKQEKKYQCRAFKQLPKEEQKTPPKGCSV